MQFRVRVKTNDNENVEEWWPPSLILGGLANDLLALIGFQAETIELLIEWNCELQAHINALVGPVRHIETLVGRVNQLEGENIRLSGITAEHSRKFSSDIGLHNLLVRRINDLGEENARQRARIERLERILARNGTTEAIELRSRLISEVNGRYVGEEPDPNGARPGEVCPHCGLPARAHTVEYEDSGPVAVCPGPGGARFREAEGSPIDKWDTYKPRQVVT